MIFYLRSRPQDENSVTDEINISWSIPKDDGGFPITGYRIEMLDIQTNNWIEITFVEVGTFSHYWYFFNKLPIPSLTHFRREISTGPLPHLLTRVDSIFISWNSSLNKWSQNKKDIAYCFQGFEPKCTLSNILYGIMYRFRVTAYNDAGPSEPGEASDPVVIDVPGVQIAPYFVLMLNDTIALEHEKVEFRVKVLGTPKPSIQWFKDDMEVFSSDRLEIKVYYFSSVQNLKCVSRTKRTEAAWWSGM